MTTIQENIDEIVEYISANRDRIATNLNLSDVLEDDIVKHIDKALQEELSRQPYNQARPRLAPINVGKKIIGKLSSLYNEPANRDLDNSTNADLWQYYTESMRLDVAMADANRFFNTHKYTAIEPYVDGNRTPRLRVIPADRFLVWNENNTDNPSSPSVFIKFMGSGRDDSARFQLWSDTEVVTVDVGSKGKGISQKDSTKVIVEASENPYGVLPFVYITKSKYRIMPSPDEPLYVMTVLVPLLLTDTNLISKFQSYSMLYTVDVDVSNLEYGPSNIYNLKSDQSAGSKPQVGVLSPNADIGALNDNVIQQLSMFLETRNLKSSTAGTANADSASSGIALMIRNIDTTEDRKEQAVTFSQAEKDLLSLVSQHMHPVWVSLGMVSDLRAFNGVPSMSIKFAEPSPLITEDEVIDNALKKRDNGLTTQKLALAEVHPDMNSDDIDRLAEEIKDEQSTILEIRGTVEDSTGDSLDTEDA